MMHNLHGLNRRNLLRIGAALPVFSEAVLAQLSYPGEAPPGAIMINANENPLGPCPEALEAMNGILKRGGRHIFTVPFYQERCADEVRARMDTDGNVRHLMEPQYHDDPLRPDGILVFTIFSLQMLTELERIGFHTRFYQLFSPSRGILGNNAIVFETIKE